MTLKELIRRIEVVASKQPLVNMIVETDILRLNNTSDARYGVFGWVQGQHSASIENDTQTFRFSLFYVDRLTEDKGNQIEVQSVGVQTLENIIRILDESGIETSDYTLQPFNQRFLDECAGVFAQVNFEVPVDTTCGEDFADFCDDFSDDFLIF